ncbi:hypothetical protein TREMEDRAFT_63290 [Tremella mesenterica DSM 1558]|uniref:uncharacterized protein n=1 Tax=Tremella mesenterica (strain ATCC 24925 / CBS 8224 / DSM 1558 / NBRC 9311 / NRRL Y-6157 / RJB 2259-6 / UBC 559-6) TaxID=578456 RepID=UPI0003F4A208|nr:uncharacterized protein TREMEDRAFT_63290 [Tremella mesenterica DSM 1558]EIW68825.1 hypothetical protein TREMEDRAFT_63290 [Tremella mesenterica DSM 1558]
MSGILRLRILTYYSLPDSVLVAGPSTVKGDSQHPTLEDTLTMTRMHAEIRQLVEKACTDDQCPKNASEWETHVKAAAERMGLLSREGQGYTFTGVFRANQMELTRGIGLILSTRQTLPQCTIHYILSLQVSGSSPVHLPAQDPGSVGVYTLQFPESQTDPLASSLLTDRVKGLCQNCFRSSPTSETSPPTALTMAEVRAKMVLQAFARGCNVTAVRVATEQVDPTGFNDQEGEVLEVVESGAFVWAGAQLKEEAMGAAGNSPV